MYFSKDYISEKETVEEINSNVLCIKVNELLEKEPKERYAFQEQKTCGRCGLIVNYMSIKKKNQMWLCENCKKRNKFKSNVAHIIKSHVEFSDSGSLLERKPILIVFVIDVSGSMVLQDRLNTIKLNTIKALKQIRDVNPYHKVILETFSSQDQSYWYKYVDKKFEKESTIKMNDFIQNSFKIQNFENWVEEVPTIEEAFDSLSEQIHALQAGGETFIAGALAHSILLASVLENSAVILCTDGANSDFTNSSNEETAYFSEIADKAKQNSTKIFITRMDNCNLSKFEIISRKTGGSIQEMRDIKSTFEPIVELILKNNLAGTCKFILLSNLNLVHLKLLYDSKEYAGVGRIEIDNMKKNTDQLLIEATILKKQNINNRTEPVVFFQVQLLSYDAKTQCHQNRIITKALDWINFKKLNISNEPIIHVNYLAWIAHHLLEKKDLIKAKNDMIIYEKFVKENGLNSEESNALHKVIINYNFAKVSDEDIQLLSNLTNIKIEDLKSYRPLNPFKPKKLRAVWIPNKGSTRNLTLERSKSALLDLRRAQSNLHLKNEDNKEKILINTTIDLQLTQAPITKFFLERNKTMIELPTIKSLQQNKSGSTLFIDYLSRPIAMQNNVKLNLKKGF